MKLDAKSHFRCFLSFTSSIFCHFLAISTPFPATMDHSSPPKKKVCKDSHANHSPKEIPQSQDCAFYPPQTVASRSEERQEPYLLFTVANVQFDHHFPFDASTKMKFLLEIAKKDINDGKLTLKLQSPTNKSLLQYIQWPNQKNTGKGQR